MNVEMPQNGRLEFHLSSQDMSRMNITFDELDYSNAETRRIVWTLIDTARHSFNMDFEPTGRMLVEVFPENDGCKLCITALPPTTRRVAAVAKRDLTQHIFEFTLDGLLDLIGQTKKLPITLGDGELFKNGEKYRLIIPLSDSQHNLLCEYGAYKGCDELALTSTREHWAALKRISS